MSDPTRTQEDLSAWLDGELTPEESADLEAELQRDPALRAELAGLEGVVRLLREQGPAEAPAGFHAAVMDRVEREHPVERFDLLRWLTARWESLAIGLAAVAAVALAMPVGLSLREGAEGPAEASPAAARQLGEGGDQQMLDPTPDPSQRGLAAPDLRAGRPENPKILGRASTPEGGVPPLPEVAVSAELADEASTWRTSIAGADGRVKGELLDLARRFGGARTLEGEPITDPEWSGDKEQLVIQVPPDRLEVFRKELEARGLEVEAPPPESLREDTPVAVRITLRPEGARAEAPAAASPSAEQVGR
jgi:hypothetical protein